MRKTRVVVTCLECGSSFEETPYRIARGRGKFCSSACYGPNRQGRRREGTYLACAVCTTPFYVKQSRRLRGAAEFCSRACQGRAKIETHSTPEYLRELLISRSKCWGTDGICWVWTGARMPTGYGIIRYPGKKGSHTGAHRISYMLHNGNIHSGLHVLHRCDNPSCVNPSHLFLGTPKDNMQDMLRKGRQRGGPNAPGAVRVKH